MLPHVLGQLGLDPLKQEPIQLVVFPVEFHGTCAQL